MLVPVVAPEIVVPPVLNAFFVDEETAAVLPPEDVDGLKNVSMLYLLIIEHLCTDKPFTPGKPSSSSRLTFSSATTLHRLLSRYITNLLNLFKVERRSY